MAKYGDDEETVRCIKAIIGTHHIRKMKSKNLVFPEYRYNCVAEPDVKIYIEKKHRVREVKL